MAVHLHPIFKWLIDKMMGFQNKLVALPIITGRHALLIETMIVLVDGLAFIMHQASHEDPWWFMETLEENAAHSIT